MKTCKASGRDGGGLTPEQIALYCPGNPWRCGYFNPNRYFCPCVETSGGWSTKKYNAWKEWRTELNASTKEYNKKIYASDRAVKYKRNLKNKRDTRIFHLVIIAIIILCVFWILKMNIS